MQKAVLLASAFAVCASPLFAADILVPGDQPSIEAALAAASAGDRILLVQDATPYPIDTLEISVDVTIEADSGVSPVAEIANSALRGMRLSAGTNLTLRGFTIDGSANVPGIDLACPTIVLVGGSDLVIDGMTFLYTSSRAIDGRNLSDPVNLTITDSVFNGSGNRIIQLNNIPNGTCQVVITDSVFTAAGDDAIALRNSAVFDATIERNVLYSAIDPGADAIQVGGSAGTTMLIRDNIIYDWEDDAIQIESDDSAEYTIETNTMFNVGTGVNLDASGNFTGTIDFRQNLVVEWNQGLTGGNASKGYALSASDNDGTWTITNNAFFDAENDQFQLGTNTTIDGTNVTGDDAPSVIFVSTDPASADFLRLAPSSPARDVAGSGLDAGAIRDASSVANWLLFD